MLCQEGRRMEIWVHWGERGQMLFFLLLACPPYPHTQHYIVRYYQARKMYVACCLTHPTLGLCLKSLGTNLGLCSYIVYSI